MDRRQELSEDIHAHEANIRFHADRYGETLLRLAGDEYAPERAERLVLAAQSVPSWAILEGFDERLPAYVRGLIARAEKEVSKRNNSERQ